MAYGSLLTILEHTVVVVAGVITIILMTIVLISTSSKNKTKAYFFKTPIPTSQCMVIQYHKAYQASSTKRHSISLEEAYSLQSLPSLTTECFYRLQIKLFNFKQNWGGWAVRYQTKFCRTRAWPGLHTVVMTVELWKKESLLTLTSTLKLHSITSPTKIYIYINCF